MKGVIIVTAPDGTKVRVVKSWIIKWEASFGTHHGKTVIYFSPSMFIDIKETPEDFDALYEATQ